MIDFRLSTEHEQVRDMVWRFCQAESVRRGWNCHGLPHRRSGAGAPQAARVSSCALGRCDEWPGRLRGLADMREKARWVLREMERRLGALGFSWKDVTATQLYTVHNVHPFLADEIVGRGAAAHGLTWHYCRPPVIGLEYEMDCRVIADDTI